MRKLDPHFKQLLNSGEVPDNVVSQVVVDNGSKGPNAPLYRTFGRGVTLDWFSNTKVLEKYTPSLADLTTMYFNQIWTFYGPKPFEVWLNNSYLRELFYGIGRFDTNWSLLDNEAEYSPFLKALIIDTGNFIATGKRQVPLRILISYHMDHCNQQETAYKSGNTYVGEDAAPIIKRLFRENHFDGMSSRNFFLTWLRQPGGVEDFIMAHRMMFGV